MRRGTSSVASLAPQNFQHNLINGTIFGGKKYICFDFFLKLVYETFLIPRRIQRDIVINVKKSPCKIPLYSCPILMKLEFSRHIIEKARIQNFLKIMGREGRTGRNNSRFSQFCERA
jgi:hypothetical protein